MFEIAYSKPDENGTERINITRFLQSSYPVSLLSVLRHKRGLYFIHYLRRN